MQRRSFLGALVATAAGLLVPERLLEDDPKRVYSFVRRPLSALAARNAALDSILNNLDSKLELHSAPPPLLADQELSQETLLAELKFDGSGFSGDADRAGTASWLRYSQGGKSFDVPIGMSGKNIEMASRSIVTCSRITITPIT